ncbi:uncharacterized protein DS421_9g257260 [Arachis hypogaea]|nr:uncharacterized protein DS421_9g257260 [Arachis hypogaea]
MENTFKSLTPEKRGHFNPSVGFKRLDGTEKFDLAEMVLTWPLRRPRNREHFETGHITSSRASSDDEAEEEEEEIIKDHARNPGPCPARIIDCSAVAAISPAPPSQKPQLPLHVPPQIPPLSSDDEELVQQVVSDDRVCSDFSGCCGSIVARWGRAHGANGHHRGLFGCKHKQGFLEDPINFDSLTVVFDK